MKAIVKDVDRFRGNVLIHFGSGEAVIFHRDFLYANRNSKGNRIMSEEDSSTEDLTFSSRGEAKVLKEKVLVGAISKRGRLRELSEAATRACDRNRKGKRSSYDQGT